MQKPGNESAGEYIPQCSDDGNYERKQCHRSTGYCWCVEPETVEYVNGTKKGPNDAGKLNCEIHIPIPPTSPVYTIVPPTHGGNDFIELVEKRLQ